MFAMKSRPPNVASANSIASPAVMSGHDRPNFAMIAPDIRPRETQFR